MKNILTNIKNNLSKASLNKKLYVFLVCLFLSTLYWVINTLSIKCTSTIDIGVEYKNQPPQCIILSELPLKLTLNVTTDGYHLLWYQLKFNKPRVVIDFSDYQVNNLQMNHDLIFNDFRSTLSNQLGNMIVINTISPNKVSVILDKKVLKLLKVVPDVKLFFKNQFQLSDSIIAIPNVIEVIGPATILDTLSFISTSFIEINNIESSVTKKVMLNNDFLKKYHLYTVTNSLELKISADKFTEYKMNLPVLITNVTDTVHIDILPSAIEVKFLIPLNKLSKINPLDFEVVVDFNELSSSYKKLKVHLLRHPDFVRNLTLKPAKVEYVLKRKGK